MMVATKRVAVVDDNEDILEFIKEALEYEGYDVETNTDGSCIRRFSRGHMPDLVLLDIQLSGEDGPTLCRQLKSNERTRHLPVILYSAQDTSSHIQKEVGADDFLAKPFSLQTLTDRVRQLLS